MATIGAGGNPRAVAVNPAMNKVYVTNNGSGSVTVLDGVSIVSTISSGANPVAVSVNPITNKAYVTNLNSANVTVITEQNVQPIPLMTTISALPGNIASTSTPSFTFTASSGSRQLRLLLKKYITKWIP